MPSSRITASRYIGAPCSHTCRLETVSHNAFACLTLQQSLCVGCSKVFETDRIELLRRQVTANKRARRVAAKKACAICNEVLRAPTSGKESVHVCVFECGHCYHLPCLEEKMRMWKRADVVDSGDMESFRRTLGCFVCDHSTREYARSDGLAEQLGALAALPPARGLTEDQLQRAKDTLLTSLQATSA